MPRVKGSDDSIIEESLGLAAGTALVLDRNLKVRLATPGLSELLGFDVPLGASAPKLLCGQAVERPLAEALAEGRPVRALLHRPTTGRGARALRVRSVPITREGVNRGWLLFIEDATGAGDGPVHFHGMWTQDARMKELFRILGRIASEDVTVLVRGETGSGKELVAKAIHTLSPRRAGPFRAINCAALPPHLLESELFGHLRGAFTGAVRDAPGHVVLADRGTLFLDEVAELPLELQAKLLRVLETHTVLPVGGREPVPVDIRVISATHRSLRADVVEGRFRADLMYRLRVIPVFLPPLRDRTADVALLAEKIIDELNGRSRRRIEQISGAAMAVLRRHSWPGNVRELYNAITYAFVTGDGPVLRPADLPPELVSPEIDLQMAEFVSTPPEMAMPADPEARRILAVLERTDGNRDRAAKILGLSRVTLWRRMRALGLTSTSEQ